MQTLSQRIHELREEKDLSLREFARQLGDISPAHISDIENGRRNPSDDLLQKMARVLGAKFDELKGLDNRLPVEELRRAMRADPAYGFALRKVTEGKVTANELLELAAKKRGEKKEGKP
ncbi:MAG: helix-turn-helix transcriptional regulator [Bryobacteraceae bacterium]